MRKDVRIGVVVSLVLVVAAGWYYLRKSPQEQTIPLGAETPAGETASGKTVASTDPGQQKAGAQPDVIRRTSPRTADRTRPRADRTTRNGTKRQTPAQRKKTQPKPRQSAAKKAPTAIPDDLLALGPAAQKEDPERPPASLKDLLPLGRETGGDEREQTAPETDRSGQDDPSPGRTPGETSRRTGLSGTNPTQPPAKRETTARKQPERSARGKTPQPPATAPQAAKPGVKTYTVERGDTFSVLAEIHYGSQRHTQFLIQANPHVQDPNRLPVGTELRIPPLNSTAKSPVAKQAAKRSSAPGTYTVRDGDSFYEIARVVLGDANRWPELFELNKDLVNGDAARLRPGQVLRLPPGKRTAGK